MVEYLDTISQFLKKLIKKKTEFKVLAPIYKNKYLKSLSKNYKEESILPNIQH